MTKIEFFEKFVSRYGLSLQYYERKALICGDQNCNNCDFDGKCGRKHDEDIYKLHVLNNDELSLIKKEFPEYFL